MKFRLVETCDTCPWRINAPRYQFPPSYFERLQETCDVGFGALFPCHRAPDDVCVGYLLSDDAENNRKVRWARLKGHFYSEELSSDVPVFRGFVQMAAANGVTLTLRMGSK